MHYNQISVIDTNKKEIIIKTKSSVISTGSEPVSLPGIKFDEEKTLGIIKKITKGFATPPVKYNKPPNCNISITRKIKADLSDN